MVKIGMVIGDRYEIQELIGTGGMSDVYRARCNKLNRVVAVVGGGNAAVEEGMNTLQMAGARNVIDGVTSIAEMMRVAYDMDAVVLDVKPHGSAPLSVASCEYLLQASLP